MMNAPCKFKFNEYFGEQIVNESGQECSYNSFSSGERKRIDLAILFTFMDIRRLQGNTAINLAFYDELLDTSLDDKGIESFIDILTNRVEKYGEACYIISHKNSAIKTATNDVIFLEKKNGFTTIGKLIE
jgi:ABC-type Mn2+/Zn2+ transport system ATPase subunit